MSKAVFDPGFFTCLTSFPSNIELLYSELNSVKNFAQKKIQFLMTYKRVNDLLNAHTGFYAGCMFWGAYLKTLGSEKIENNPFLNQEYNKELSLSELNYMLDFIKKFDRDTKYYMGKPFKFDEKKMHILETYIEFLDLNKGFSNVDTTDKIQLTGKLTELSKEEIEKIEQKIQDVIHTGKVEELLEFCDKI